MKDKTVIIKRIRKRDGHVVPFETAKITTAIGKASAVTGEFGEKEAKRLTGIVVEILRRAGGKSVPLVEQVQDIVEQVLMAASYYRTAKAYILYRQARAQLRAVRKVLGVEDDLGMSVNALKAMARRYLLKDAEGNVVETPRQAVERVARAVALVEKRGWKKWEQRFAEAIGTFAFVPGGCYFRGAGQKRGLLANCFVLPVEDDMEAIFEAVKWTALIHQAGGGTGYNFSKLRPNGDQVGGGGFASGPVSFMKAFDAATEIVMLGGRHRGANMGILNADHPDILDFITCKTQEGEITNFNISLGASDRFMKAVAEDGEWQFINPRTGQVVTKTKARTVFDQAVALAWKTGDPGMIYLDAINRNNPLIDSLGPITATNVCGEQPLHPFDVCNLGSINLGKFIKSAKCKVQSAKGKREDLIDWGKLEEVVRLAVRFLDDGVDVSYYPLTQITKMAHQLRRIGLGVMGWADMLIRLGVRYDSKEGVRLAAKVMEFIQRVGWEESALLAGEKGVFPLWKESSFARRHPVLGNKGCVRNIAVTTIAPTGTISMVADCNSGIEPLFALSYIKDVVDHEGLTYLNNSFEQTLVDTIGKGERLVIEPLLHEVAKTGSAAVVPGIPQWIKEVFRTAHDILPEWHVKMQAAFQAYTDNAVSKTVNFPQTATIEDVERAYILAWKLGCKGITIYRDKSKAVQILEKVSRQDIKIQSKLSLTPLAARAARLSGKEEVSLGECPECGGPMAFSEGCSKCVQCGYSRCEV